ncbi:MAG: D-ribose pyranase [Firmicutes bacterium]|jgi:D-ribose pyranase|nr:D-ribose pyranase [Bacillota bacterium]
MVKAREILNSQLSRVLGEMGHTDQLLITDAGLPIPLGIERVDLAVVANVPPFLTVLASVLEHLTIEGAVLSEEITDRSPELWADIQRLLPSGIRVSMISHQDFKARLPECRAAVRTGEFTWYANIILIGGVSF